MLVSTPHSVIAVYIRFLGCRVQRQCYSLEKMYTLIDIWPAAQSYTRKSIHTIFFYGFTKFFLSRGPRAQLRAEKFRSEKYTLKENYTLIRFRF